MKTTWKTLVCLLLLLATFTGTVSCGQKTDGPEESSGTDTDGQTGALSLGNYSIVYSDEASASVRTAARKLKLELERFYGNTVELASDSAARENENEIVIGNTSRGIPDGKTASGDAYRIVTDEKKLYVIGDNDAAVVEGIYRLLLHFDRWQTELASLDVTGRIGESVLTADNIGDFDILLPDSGTVATRCATHIRSKIKECFGVELAMTKAANSSKQNHIIIGNIDTSASNAVTFALSPREYAVKTELDGSNINIYIAGYDDVALWRAAVYFYDQCVTHAGFDIPILMNVKIKAVFARDPYILEVDDTYYLYVNVDDQYWGAYTSTDLVNWSSDCIKVCDPANQPAEFDGVADFWAPEVHEYKGSYYMFVTYRRKDAEMNNGYYYRVAGIFRSDSPTGPFVFHGSGPVAPYDGMIADGVTVSDASTWSVIDATLYVDESDNPWIVFSHEWVSLNNGGTFCAARLSEDLSHIEGEVHTLFNTYDGYQSNEAVTDAAFIYRTGSGQLLLLWSNFDYDRKKGYRVYIARSESGDILGHWTHDTVYLYEKDMDTIYTLYDGGHPSILKDPDGKLLLCIHSPSTENESINLIPIEDTGTTLQIEKYR